MNIFIPKGQLWAMEVDPDSAMEEFKDIVKTALGPPKESGAGGGGGGGMMGNLGLPDFKGEISEMLSGLLELNRECFPNEN